MKTKIISLLLLLSITCQFLLTSCYYPAPNAGGSEKEEEEAYDSLDDINVPDRFKSAYTIDREKLEGAVAAALEKLLLIAEEADGKFPSTCSTDYQYTYGENNNWTCGMYTGTYLMAYQLTGDKRFSDIVEEHLLSYSNRASGKIGMDDHDVGFVFVPSCVGAYKVLGSGIGRHTVLNAVEYYYGTSYSQEGNFIIRSHRSWNNGSGCRTMIDSMMNATILLWTGDYFGNADYLAAGTNHSLTSARLLVRNDGSSYHHYQFDPLTARPLYGLTWQGLADDSCWSRGQSWGIYGFSIAHSYTQNSELYNAQIALTDYMLNHLPSDLIPYWDYTFTAGAEPRDASAAAIAVCGMLDMAEQLPENSARRLVYESAAAQILEALIDHCTGDIGVEYDGLIYNVTHGKPQGLAVGECAPYADYFYIEALTRFLNADFIRPW